jgi:hypothetical protein
VPLRLLYRLAGERRIEDLPLGPRNIASGHDSGQTNSTARIQRREAAA